MMGSLPMKLQRQILFWISSAIIFLLIIALLREILLPFILGMGIAYFLDPLADRLEKAGFTRLWATIFIVAFFLVIVFLALFFLVPPLLQQLAGFIGKIPAYFHSAREFTLMIAERYFGTVLTEVELGIERSITTFAEQSAEKLAGSVTTIISGGMALVNFLSLFLIMPVVAFYLLKDWDRMIAHIDSVLPRKQAPVIRELAREIDEVLAGFVRGQVTVMILLGLFYATGLAIVGLNFGLLIGFGAGLISFIPFVGAITGLVVSGLVATIQFWPDWIPIALVIGIFLSGQLIEGNVLSPLIVGDRVGLHPVWLIFSLFVFGYLLGFVGLLMAVPLAASIGVIVRFAINVYLDSDMYDSNKSVEPSDRNQTGNLVE